MQKAEGSRQDGELPLILPAASYCLVNFSGLAIMLPNILPISS